jgi:multiple sugar transport system substrate-binding protein
MPPLSDIMTTRRSLLKNSGLVIGSAAVLTTMQGCGFGGGSSSSGNVTLDAQGWVYDPTFQQNVAKQFAKDNPTIDPKLTFSQGEHYLEKVIALYTSGNAPDVVFAHDNDIANFADAGYIQPVDGMAGLDTYLADLVQFDRDGLNYNGKTWGTPYYGDVMAFIYNSDMTKKAGISETPVTWDDVMAQALQVKKAGILDTPFVFPMDNTASYHWRAVIKGSGGELFDENNKPVFAGDDPTALNFLTWLVSARKAGVLDPSSLGLGTTTGKQAFQAGRSCFATAAHYDMKAINDPKQSKVAGACAQVLMPSLTDNGPHATLGFSAAYCVSSKTKHPKEAWELVKALGAPPANKQLFLRDGQAPAYKALQNDPDVITELKKWCDPDIANKQSLLATRQNALTAPWFAEWQMFNQQQVQQAILGKKSPKDALQTSSDKAVELSKQ